MNAIQPQPRKERQDGQGGRVVLVELLDDLQRVRIETYLRALTGRADAATQDRSETAIVAERVMVDTVTRPYLREILGLFRVAAKHQHAAIDEVTKLTIGPILR
ncbi:MAG: hypothetical protein ACK56I_14100 [bacterium]